MEDSEDSIQTKILNFAKPNLLILGLFLVGVILIGIGLIQMLGQNQATIKFESGQEVAGSAISKIKVDVEGEVLKPGVYELASDSRVQDALIAAGGLTSNANRKSINLAAKITDGQKIYIPAKGEVISASNNNPNQGSNLNSGLNSGMVSINSAIESELDKLPGIGPVTAGKIIDNRPYSSVEELLERKVVGKATFEKIKNLITL